VSSSSEIEEEIISEDLPKHEDEHGHQNHHSDKSDSIAEEIFSHNEDSKGKSSSGSVKEEKPF
jgi:hypothetical protein